MWCGKRQSKKELRVYVERLTNQLDSTRKLLDSAEQTIRELKDAEYTAGSVRVTCDLVGGVETFTVSEWALREQTTWDSSLSWCMDWVARSAHKNENDAIQAAAALHDANARQAEYRARKQGNVVYFLEGQS